MTENSATWAARLSPAIALSILLSAGGCQWFGQRNSVSTYYNLPLTVVLREDAGLAAATLDYKDACGQSAALPIQEPLRHELAGRMGHVFQRVQSDAGATTQADGVVDVALGPRQVDLFVPRKAEKSYPATVTVGLDMSYRDAQGRELHEKKLQSSVTGEVTAHADRCDITGLDAVAREAIAVVVEGVAQQLGTSTKIREQAQLRKEGRLTPGPIAAAPAPAMSEATTAPVRRAAVESPPQPAGQTPTDQPTSPAELKPTTLSFRTIVRDENQNHVLEQQEAFTVEFEVKNDGAGIAHNVEIVLSGHPAVVGGLTPTVGVGTLQPGESRRIAASGRVGAVPGIEQAELMCSLRASANVTLPSAKKFFVAVRPDRADAAEVLSVDVDQLPTGKPKMTQPHAVGIAVGIETFRDSALPAKKFAARDAEVMGAYYQRVLGLSPQHIVTLTDDKALKDDVTDVLEQWLLKQGRDAPMAYIYISGRGLVDGESGALSVVPYDGSIAASGRNLSLARLYRALSRAQVKQAVLFFDLSLEPAPGAASSSSVTPQWGPAPGATEGDRRMVFVGNAGLQEAQAYQPGKHGLFTYAILKGLRGAADLDKNGSVTTGELCTYAQGQVQALPGADRGAAQQTLCLPAAGDRSPLRGITLSKSR